MKTKKIIITSLIALGSISMHAQRIQTSSGQTGFGTTSCNATNRVEITTKLGDPYFNSTNGSSGLKLTNLPNTKLTVVGSGKVLSTDLNGDVILVNDQTAAGNITGAQNGCSVFGGNTVHFGNVLGGTSANLLNNRELPQNNNSILFSGNNVNDRIKIGGTSGSTNSNSRLFIENHKPLNQTFTRFPGLHVFSDADANKNIGALFQLQDKNATSFAQNNKGVQITSTGLGDQYGAVINATSNVNSTSSICHGMKLTSTSLGNLTMAFGIDLTSSSNGTSRSLGVTAEAKGAATTGTNIGGYFIANGNNPFPSALNIGMSAIGENVQADAIGISDSVTSGNTTPIQPNSIHKGVDINVSTGTNNTSIQNLTQYGIKSDVRNLGIVNGASAGGKLYGVYSRALNESQPAGNFINIGVYATAETSNIIDGSIGTQSNIALYATTKQLNWGPQSVGKNSWAGFFDGDVYIGGSNGVGGGGFYGPNIVLYLSGSGINTNSSITFSDRRFKNDIKKMEEVQSKIKKLTGYTYNLRTTEFKDKNFSSGEQFGLIAQELQEVFPQLVSEQKDGYLAVNYDGMLPVLLEAAKERQTQIEMQDNQIDFQQRQIDELKLMVKSLQITSEN